MKKDAYAKTLYEIFEECNKHGVGLLLDNKKKVKLPEETEEMGSGGFFDDETKLLAVATKRPFKQWIKLLLHEFHHMKQWIENNYEFDYDERWQEWVEGERELTKKELKKTINSARRLELDCEKRTAEFLRTHPELEINVDEYIKDANAYLYFYTIVAKYRKWNCKRSPYFVPEILELMPTKFVKNYWELPEKYEELIVDHCLTSVTRKKK